MESWEEKWGPVWAAWAKAYPAKIVTTKPDGPWYESDDYIEAVKACDNCELLNDIACEVVVHDAVFYVLPKI